MKYHNETWLPNKTVEFQILSILERFSYRTYIFSHKTSKIRNTYVLMFTFQ